MQLKYVLVPLPIIKTNSAYFNLSWDDLLIFCLLTNKYTHLNFRKIHNLLSLIYCLYCLSFPFWVAYPEEIDINNV